MEAKEYLKFFIFVTRYTHLNTALDKRSYNDSTLNNHINLPAFKTKFSSVFDLDNFYKDFTTVTDLFTSEVLSQENFYNFPDIDTVYQILKFISSKDNNKLKGFNDTQLLTIRKAFNQMHDKFNNDSAIDVSQQLAPDNFINQATSGSHDDRLKSLENNHIELSAKLDQFMNKMIELTSNNQINCNQQSLTSTQTNIQESSFENTDSLKASNLFNKKLRYENHIKNSKLLIDNGKVFTQLSYKKLPLPFFSDNTEFVTKYNKLVNTFQSDTMKLINESAALEVKNIETKITEIKSKYNESTDIEGKLQSITDKCQLGQHTSLQSSNNKVQRILDSNNNNEFTTSNKVVADFLFTVSTPISNKSNVINIRNSKNNNRNNKSSNNSNNRNYNNNGYNNRPRINDNNDNYNNINNRTQTPNFQHNHRITPLRQQVQENNLRNYNNNTYIDNYRSNYNNNYLNQTNSHLNTSYLNNLQPHTPIYRV